MMFRKHPFALRNFLPALALMFGIGSVMLGSKMFSRHSLVDASLFSSKGGGLEVNRAEATIEIPRGVTADIGEMNLLEAKRQEAKQAIARISKKVSEHYLLRHDFLRCFSEGKLGDIATATKLFAWNHYTYSKNFIKYLTLVRDKLRDNHAIALISENMKEESGDYEEEDLQRLEEAGVNRELVSGIPHKALITHFLNVSGVSDEQLSRTDTIGANFTRDMIELYQNSNPCEALAVIGFAIEETVSHLYQYIWDGLKKSDLKPSDYVFFPLHILVDDGHADLLKGAFEEEWVKDTQSCANAEALVFQVLDRRAQMFADLRDLVESVNGEGLCDIPKYSEHSSNVRVTQSAAVAEAAKNANALPDPGWSLKQKMALAARILAEEGHGKTLSGQVTCRAEHPSRQGLAMLTQVYGKALEELTVDDFILVDENLDVLEGHGKPNMANRFHVHVYRVRPDIQCMIHTHPLHASALAQLGVPLHVAHMDVMGLHEDVAFLSEWPGIPFGDEEGEIISGVLGADKWSGLLAHHGIITAGKTIEETTYRAFFLERAAHSQLQMMAVVGRDLELLPQVDYERARRAHDWRLNPGATRAHFNSWARQALRDGHADAFTSM